MNLYSQGSGYIAAALVLAALASPASAQKHVSVNTGNLGAGTYYAEFTLTDGSSSGDGNSQAVITTFSLTGGMVTGTPTTFGSGVTGDLGSTLTLRDSDSSSPEPGLADFEQQFTVSNPASVLSFGLNLSATGVDAPTPDNFSFLILDSGQNAIATNGPTFSELVSADYDSLSPTPTGYEGTYNGHTITATVTSVGGAPEPSEWAALAFTGLGLGGLLVRARRRTPAR